MEVPYAADDEDSVLSSSSGTSLVPASPMSTTPSPSPPTTDAFDLMCIDIEPFRKHHGLFVSIDGNIGSGKSTLVDALGHAYPDLHTYPEPLDRWVITLPNGVRCDLLKEFYAARRARAFMFQHQVFTSRVAQYGLALQQSKTHETFVVERSMFTDREVFASALAASGDFAPLDYAVYQNSWRLWLTMMPYFRPAAIVYMHTSPETCMERVRVRNRGNEADKIQLEYLLMLENAHAYMIYNFKQAGVPVLQLDGNVDLATVKTVYIPQIRNFIGALHAPVHSRTSGGGDFR